MSPVMSLEHIFYVSQSIAAVAVIASLLYLSQQVRQSERVQRATMQQARADRITQATLALADPKLACVTRLNALSGETASESLRAAAIRARLAVDVISALRSRGLFLEAKGEAKVLSEWASELHKSADCTSDAKELEAIIENITEDV